MFGEKKEQTAYSRLQDETESLDLTPQPHEQRQRIFRLIGGVLVFLLACAASFTAGCLLSRHATEIKSWDNVIHTVPASGHQRQQVNRDPAMEMAPPADGTHEPSWDALLPNGLGFVQHPTLAPEVAAVGVFHQLHCLYTIRRAYYAAYAASVGQPFNNTGVRPPDHIAHCFTYIQQGLLCSADSGIEPYHTSNSKHINFERRCNNYEGVKAWAEENRAFEGHGFLFDVSTHRSLDSIVFGSSKSHE